MSLPTDDQILKTEQNISNFNKLYTQNNTPDPTPENIAIVQKNLENIQAFNDYIYANGQGINKTTNT